MSHGQRTREDRLRRVRACVESLDRRLLLSFTLIHEAAESFPQIAQIGDSIYFNGTDTDHGVELWKTDGTAAGSQLVRDITPGAASTSLSYFNAAGGLLYFVTVKPNHEAIWRTDGTDAGTVQLFARDGDFDDPDIDLTPVGNKVFFLDPANLNSLWVTDGTVGGTHALTSDLLADVQSIDLAAHKGRLFFTGTRTIEVGKQTDRVAALFFSDGTAEGTVVVDTLPKVHDAPTELLSAGGQLVFRQVGGLYDVLWTSLGTPGTTRTVGGLSEFYLRVGTLGSNNTWPMWQLGNRLILGVADDGMTHLYAVDVAKNSAKRIADVPFSPISDNDQEPRGMLYDGRLYLHSSEMLTETDGTAAGTRTIAVSSSLSPSFRTTGSLYLEGSGANGQSGLWRLDDGASEPVYAANVTPWSGLPRTELNSDRCFFVRAPVAGLFIHKPQLGTVAGVVLHDFDASVSWFDTVPAAGIRVFVDLNANGRRDTGEPSALSDSEGKYSIDVKPGEWTLGFVKPSKTWKLTKPTTKITVLADQQTDASIAILDTGSVCTLSGHVYRDLDHDGTYDAGEGFPDAEVYLDLNRNNRRDANEPMSVSDLEGGYHFSDLTEGYYSVRIVPQRRWYFGEYDTAFWLQPDFTRVAVESGKDNIYDRPVTRKAHLSGYVFNDLNANSQRDPGEPGIPGRAMSLDVHAPDWKPGQSSIAIGGTTVTGEDGYYSFLVPTLDFDVGPTSIAGMRQTLAPSFDEPAHDGAVLSADFGFTEKAKLTGKVTKDYLLDMSGFDSTVLAGWRIVLSGRPQGSQNAVKRSVLTDDDGNFSFDSIAPGTYTARLMRRDSGCGITSADRFKLTIGPGEYRSIEFKVTKTWSVQGTFFGDVNLNGANDPGEGLAGVVVFVDRDSDRKLDEDERFTKTDKHGKYQLSDLMGNETRIACTPPAGWRGKTGFKLDPDSPSNTVNIAFTNTAKVLGFAFLDEKRDGVYGWGDSYDGYGLCTAWVDYDNDDVVDVNEPTAKSADGDFIYGEFSIGHVTPGIRWIKFRCPDGRRMTTVSAYKLDLKPGQTSTRVNFGYK